ncbi:MAG: hypothetical protein ABSF65_11940 [Candidatus Bathyarchaeia archaeon]|jgi:hypothetical protein
MTVGLGFVISVCDYVNGKTDKNLDEITEKIISKVRPDDLQDFFEKIALFSSTNNRFQELKANCETILEMKHGKIIA